MSLISGVVRALRKGQALSVGTYAKMVAPVREQARSVVFIHNSYYHFYYLAEALRKRGWDAISVSSEDPINGAHAKFYHGEDLNIFSSHPRIAQFNEELFFRHAKKRFRLMHFAGDGYLSFFRKNFGLENPPDIAEWKALGKKVAYTISGETSMVSQDSVFNWSRLESELALCEKCPWQSRPDVCSNEKNLKWGKVASTCCDLIFAEGYPALDYLTGPKIIRDPLSMCLSSEIWRPNLNIPAKYKIERKPNELLVFHSVGNYELRKKGDRNIKGTQAVFEAIEQLKSEGLKARLIFCTDVPSSEVRFFQAQADVVVDQLNSGRYGANARESMMLGKATICYLHRTPVVGEQLSEAILECPMVSATELTIKDELRNLLENKILRDSIGNRCREYALKWHDMDASAARYEAIYDQLMISGYNSQAQIRSESAQI